MKIRFVNTVIQTTLSLVVVALISGCASGVRNPSGVPVTEMQADERGFVAGLGIDLGAETGWLTDTGFRADGQIEGRFARIDAELAPDPAKRLVLRHQLDHDAIRAAVARVDFDADDIALEVGDAGDWRGAETGDGAAIQRTGHHPGEPMGGNVVDCPRDAVHTSSRSRSKLRPWVPTVSRRR